MPADSPGHPEVLCWGVVRAPCIAEKEWCDNPITVSPESGQQPCRYVLIIVGLAHMHPARGLAKVALAMVGGWRDD